VGRSAALVVAVLVFAAWGCDASPAPTTAPLNAKAIGDGFVLETSIPKGVWSPGEVIPVATTFTWTGADQKKTVWTFGSGPVTFDLKQLDGRRFSMGSAHTADCAPKTFTRGIPTPIPFQKSGAWDGSDPDAPFYQQFFTDPLLRLPAGRYELRVGVVGQLAECSRNARSLDLDLPPIVLEVR